MITGAPRLKLALKPSSSLSDFDEIKMAAWEWRKAAKFIQQWEKRAAASDSSKQPAQERHRGGQAEAITATDSNTSIQQWEKRAAASDSSKQPAQKRHQGGQAEAITATDGNATTAEKKGDKQKKKKKKKKKQKTHKGLQYFTQLTLETKATGILDPATRTLEDYKETVKKMPKEARENFCSPAALMWLMVSKHFMEEAKAHNYDAVVEAIENHYQDVKQIAKRRASDLEVVLDEQLLQPTNLRSLSHMIKDCRVDRCNDSRTRITITAAASSSAEEAVTAIYAYLQDTKKEGAPAESQVDRTRMK